MGRTTVYVSCFSVARHVDVEVNTPSLAIHFESPGVFCDGSRQARLGWNLAVPADAEGRAVSTYSRSPSAVILCHQIREG